MTDGAYEDFDPEAERSSWFGRVKGVVLTATGALLAMALLVALGLWFYQLGVRDAQNVPIIRAAVEPAKERPVDPGGMVTPHQEIRSYEVVEGQEAQAGSAVAIAPDPPEPGPADVAMGELTPTPRPEPAAPASEPQVALAPPAERPVQTTGSDTPVPAVQPTPVEPEPEAQPEPAEPEAEPVSGPQQASTGTEFAPSASPVARARPANLRDLTRQAAERDRQQATDLARQAAASPVQVQLAADPDEGVVRRMWQQIQRANQDLLRNRALAVQTTISGGVTYYRLRVGPFRDAAEARSICQALKARGQDCIVARNS